MFAFLRKIWDGANVVAQAINWFMTGVICTVLFFTLLPLFSFRRLGDPLRKKLGADTYWEPYKNAPATLERFERPF